MDACQKIYFYPPIVSALQFVSILAIGAALLALIAIC